MKVKDTTVFVAMSGGVDSSVVAYLLKKQGYKVIGVFLKPWTPPEIDCPWKQDRLDALHVAEQLNIPLKTWDVGKEYFKHVASPMIKNYKIGKTPNPDVECNRHIKFSLFAKRAFLSGADFIATGHYAKIKDGMILKARDKNKDQTYFLWGIPCAILPKILFPIGDYTKPQVRLIAKKAKILVANKKDSQGVCFIGKIDMKKFLSKYISYRNGDILNMKKEKVGTHDGAYYYTIGQRHGLDIRDGGGPYFVVAKNIKKNEIIVGSYSDLKKTNAKINKNNWLVKIPPFNKKVSVQIRYRSKHIPATILKTGEIKFSRPAYAITPGQSAVIFSGSRLLGGGIIQ